MNLTITTYHELQEVLDHFHKGIYEILIIEGRPGTGKTYHVQKSFHHNPYCLIEGRITAAKFFQLLFEYQDLPVVADDTEGLISDKMALSLLKTLCQSTAKDKRLSWNTTRKLPVNMPTTYETRSTLILICNEWKKVSVHLSAIEDRGMHLLFNPTNQELHLQAQTLVETEVYTLFDRFLPHIKNLSLRQYVIAQRLLDQHVPWQKTLVASWGLPPLEQVYILLHIDFPGMSDHERALKFTAITGRPLATYERIQATLQG